MNLLKLNLLFVVMNVSLILPSFGQEMNRETVQPGLKKNAIYGTVGTVGIYGAAEGNYERMIAETGKGFLKSYWARVGYGGYYSWEDSGSLFVIGLTALTGARKSHMEFNVGFTSTYDRDSYEIGVSNSSIGGDPKPAKSEFRDYSPAGSIGYRFQKPGGSFIFRTGFGFPESLYVSLGFCF